MGATDVDEWAARGAANLQHVGLDVLPDAVVLGRRLVGGAQDGLGLAQVEDDARRLHAADRPGDDLALTMGEVVEEGLALSLTQALAHDLPGDLGADTAEMGGLQLLVLDEVSKDSIGIMLLGVGDSPLGGLVLDL